METTRNGGKTVFHDVVSLGDTPGTVSEQNSGEKHPNTMQLSDGLEAKIRHWEKL